jgi:tetratricopeptide (TPR) repeat protein
VSRTRLAVTYSGLIFASAAFSTSAVAAAYTIQLIAGGSAAQTAELQRQFNENGSLQTVQHQGLTKLWLGRFTTRVEADSFLVRVRHQVPDAFVRKVEDEDTAAAPIKRERSTVTVAPVQQSLSVPAASSEKNYVIQLGTGSLAQVGNIYDRLHHQLPQLRIQSMPDGYKLWSGSYQTVHSAVNDLEHIRRFVPDAYMRQVQAELVQPPKQVKQPSVPVVATPVKPDNKIQPAQLVTTNMQGGAARPPAMIALNQAVNQNDWKTALEAALRIDNDLNISPSANDQRQMGWAYYHNGYFEAARDLFLQSLEKDPASDAKTGLSQAYSKLGVSVSGQ